MARPRTVVVIGHEDPGQERSDARSGKAHDWPDGVEVGPPDLAMSQGRSLPGRFRPPAALRLLADIGRYATGVGKVGPGRCLPADVLVRFVWEGGQDRPLMLAFELFDQRNKRPVDRGRLRTRWHET